MRRKKTSNDPCGVTTGGGISVRQAGERGGRATAEKYGVDFFKAIGKKGGRRTAKLYGHLLKDFGKRGGRPERPALGGTPGEGKLKNKGGSGRHRTPSPGDSGNENNMSAL